MSQNPVKEPFKFSSRSGWRVCLKIIQEKLPFGPHNYQLDGIDSICMHLGQSLISSSQDLCGVGVPISGGRFDVVESNNRPKLRPFRAFFDTL